MKNKVKYGLKNTHYAPLTVDEAGNATFATPIPIPGSVSLTMDAQGNTETVYADNMAYFVSAANDGYSGSFEVAIIPDSFRQDILNETLDEQAQILVENINNQTNPFALLFEFQGDKRAIRHVLYNCTCGRPSVTGSTTTNTKTPTTETMNVTGAPLANGNVTAKTRNGKAHYLHCLPADITGVSCEEGEVDASGKAVAGGTAAVVASEG